MSNIEQGMSNAEVDARVQAPSKGVPFSHFDIRSSLFDIPLGKRSAHLKRASCAKKSPYSPSCLPQTPMLRFLSCLVMVLETLTGK
jgi:hypothetical protein